MIFDNTLLRNLWKIKDKLSYTQNSHECNSCGGFTHCMIYNDKTFCKYCIDDAVLNRKGFKLAVNNMKNQEVA